MQDKEVLRMRKTFEDITRHASWNYWSTATAEEENKLNFVILILLITLLASPLEAHTFYKWVDEKGIVNYTDDYNNIPSAYTDRVEIQWVHEQGPSPPIQKIAPQK